MTTGGIVLCGGMSRRMGRPKATLPFGPETLLERVVRLLDQAVDATVVVSAIGQELPELAPPVIVAHDRRPDRGPLEGLAVGLRILADRAVQKEEERREKGEERREKGEERREKGEERRANEGLRDSRPSSLFALPSSPVPGPSSLAPGPWPLAPGAWPLAFVAACDVPLLKPAFVRRMIQLSAGCEIAVPHVGGFDQPLAAVYHVGILPHVEALLEADRLRPAYLFDLVRTRRVTAEQLSDVDPELQSLTNVNSPEDYWAILARAGFLHQVPVAWGENPIMPEQDTRPWPRT